MPTAELEQRATAVEPHAFADLFLDPIANKTEIWLQMAEIVKHAAKGVRFRTPECARDCKGDALNHAIDISQAGDRPPRRPYYYFYTVIRRRLILKASKREHKLLGDDDCNLCLNDFRNIEGVPNTDLADANNPRKWRSSRLGCQSDRHRAALYFRRKTESVAALLKKSDSPEETAVLRLTSQVLREVQSDLLG